MDYQLSEYENQIFLDIFGEDGLTILARGLGVDRLVLHLLQLYSDPGNLVLIINTTALEEEYYIEELAKRGVSNLPKVINNEYSTNERKGIYLQGGVLFVTSRILVVDMLTDRLHVHLVSGIFVFKAHRIIDSCQEAFILRMYRQKNKTGFIKALSDQPQSFAAGLCQLERVMHNLFVRKLFLWPRFHASIAAFMDKHKPDVVELQLNLTPSMLALQTAILDIIAACIKELQRCNPTLDKSELTVESAIGKKSLEHAIRRQLQPLWHQLTTSTKRLIADLKLLQMLLFYLTQYDCVTFYNFLKSLRTNNKMTSGSDWLFMESAEAMFMHAKDRVYRQSKDKMADGTTGKGKETVETEFILEENPKWKVLTEVMTEIKQESLQMESTECNNSRILICASDDRTCAQLKEYLQCGGRQLLLRLYTKTEGNQAEVFTSHADRHEPSKPRAKHSWKGRKKSAEGQRSVAKDAAGTKSKPQEEVHSDDDDVGNAADDDSKDEDGSEVHLVSSPEAYYGIAACPLTVIHPLHGCKDPYSLSKTLREVQPMFVILYDAEIQFVRQLEVYKASRPGIPLRVYFLVYSCSTEEQRYLTTLRQEKEAFQHLIKEKATMVLSKEVDGRGDTAPQLSRDGESATASSNSSRAGGRQTQSQTQQKIIVDMREFRSALPSLIHKRGIDIEPVTIEVGDYILTPDICVERKSVSDLIGSLASGRLYNQATSMMRYYKTPVLLIEFDPNKSFALQSKCTSSSEISYQDISAKIVLLTLHFPKLRVLWCPSPHATAQLFEELKIGHEQPDAATAATVTDNEEVQQAKFNHTPYNMLLKMPGVNCGNVWRLLRHVCDLAELSALTQDELSRTLESAPNAALLWSFLHSETAIPGKDTDRGANKPAGKFQRGGKKYYGKKGPKR